MIKRVACFPVFVSDQDRALAFYRDKLGFAVVSDHPMDSESRWITVAPHGAETEIILFLPTKSTDASGDLRKRIGSWTGVVLLSDDIKSTYKELHQNGVKFESEPARQAWGGWETWLRDPDGNRFHLVQRPS